MRVPPLVCSRFFPGVLLSSRVTGACPVTPDLIMRVNVRTTRAKPLNVRVSFEPQKDSRKDTSQLRVNYKIKYSRTTRLLLSSRTSISLLFDVYLGLANTIAFSRLPPLAGRV